LTETVPVVPGSREDDASLLDRVERARRAREAAAKRVARRFAEIKPDERRWRVRDELKLGSQQLYVR